MTNPEQKWESQLRRLQARRDTLKTDYDNANLAIAHHISQKDSYLAYLRTVDEVLSSPEPPHE